jgi:hypothetical protein
MDDQSPYIIDRSDQYVSGGMSSTKKILIIGIGAVIVVILIAIVAISWKNMQKIKNTYRFVKAIRINTTKNEKTTKEAQDLLQIDEEAKLGYVGSKLKIDFKGLSSILTFTSSDGKLFKRKFIGDLPIWDRSDNVHEVNKSGKKIEDGTTWSYIYKSYYGEKSGKPGYANVELSQFIYNKATGNKDIKVKFIFVVDAPLVNLTKKDWEEIMGKTLPSN